MVKLLSNVRIRRKPTRLPRRRRVRLLLESLETRLLLSGNGIATLLEIESNDTLNIAQQLGWANQTSQITLVGTIGNGVTGTSDVDWSTFTLDRASRVHLSVVGQNGGPSPILGLYNNDLFDFSDPFDPTGHRLVAQAEGGFDRNLAAGTYYVALSGQGNEYFSPFLAGSGYAGAVGDYQLTVQAVDMTLPVTNGPIVLANDPSPLVVRVDLSTSLDPSGINLGQNVRLVYNANGTFGDGTDQDVNLAGSNFSTSVQELQLFPATALGAGFYQVILAGNSSPGQPVLRDLNGVALGTDATHLSGQDYAVTFQVAANQGQSTPSSANDTPATARDLGGLLPGSGIQVSGMIGSDPSYDPNGPDPNLTNPSADVNLYHFHISGPGRYAFTAEVFAGRIGSPLDPGVSLFLMDPVTGQLRFVDGNNNSQNTALATDGTVPLYNDPILFDGLSAGDYYVAVSANYNTPTSIEGGQPGTNGIFDPNVSHSGQNGFSTGLYVLNVGIQRDDTAPEVVTTSIVSGETATAPPTALVVGFSETMNLRQLSFLAYEQTSVTTVSAVYIQGSDGTKYFPRLESYDDVTKQAHFLMLDGLANGTYQLHLSGSLGLTDLAGNALVGNDPSGDYVVSFTVAGPLRGVSGDPHSWATQVGNDDSTTPQDLGVLFPHELQSGVVVTRDFTGTTNGVADTADYYQIQVLQTQSYGVTLTGANLPAGVRVTVTDLSGNPVDYSTPDGRALQVNSLPAGTYLIRVDGWPAARATQVVYQLRLNLLASSDNAPALTAGPAPALRLRLVSNDPLPVQPTFSPVIVPTSNGNPPSTPSASPNPDVILVSFQTNGVSLPNGSLQDLASGLLGGVARSTDTISIASTERTAFRLPESTAAAFLNTHFVSGQTNDSTGDASLISSNDARESWVPSETIPNTPRSSTSQERIADRIFGIANWMDQLVTIEKSDLHTPSDQTIPATEAIADHTRTVSDAQAPTRADEGQVEVHSTSGTDTEGMGGSTLTKMAAWIAGLVGVGLAWIAYRGKKTDDRLIPPDQMGTITP